jgi:hypothetical protein
MTLTELAIVVTILVIFVSGIWYVAAQVQENRNYNKTITLIGSIMDGMRSFKVTSPPLTNIDVSTPQTLDIMGISRDIWDATNNRIVDPWGGTMTIAIGSGQPTGLITFAPTANQPGGFTQPRCIDVLSALLNTPSLYNRLQYVSINNNIGWNLGNLHNITKSFLIGDCVAGVNTFVIDFSM